MMVGARPASADPTENGDTPESYARWVPPLLLLAVGIFLALRRDVQTGFFLPDDAFYYLKIADNAAAGLGLSFDGIHATNGFQFLWQMILIPLAWFARIADLDALAIVPLAQAVLLIAGTLVLLQAMRRLGARAVPAAIGASLVIFSPFVLKPLFSGMETAVDFAVLSCLWSLVALVASGASRLNRRQAIVIGALGVLSMLARFDNLVLLPAVAIAYRAADREAWVRRTLESAGVVAGGLVAYLAWNQLAFGIPLPVSGAIKSWQNYPRGFELRVWWGRLLEMLVWPADMGWALFGWMIVPVAVAAVGVALILVLSRRRSGGVHDTASWLGSWNALFLGVALHLAYLALYLQMHAATFWYYVPEFLALAVLASWAFERLGLRSRATAIACLTMAVLAYGVLYSTYTFDATRKTRFAKLPQVGAWVDQNLPKDARVGSWNAGAVGYFSNRTVVNLDGLVNDADYFNNYLKTGRTAEYLRRERIDYLIEYYQDATALQSSGLGYRTIKVFPYRVDDRSLFRRGGTSHSEYYVVAEKGY